VWICGLRFSIKRFTGFLNLSECICSMDDAIYLNHAGTNWPTPVPVADAVVDAMRSHPVQWPKRFEKAHAGVCRFFGVADPDQLLLTPGCNSSLSTAIASVALPAGSRVLASHWEHHAVHGPLQKLRDKGVAVDFVSAGDDSRMDLAALE
jgi:selenocysteine lyase/cysteine desulfurase